MSFIILTLIIILLYATLTKYSSIYKAILMSALLIGMTSMFLIYGIGIFRTSDIFVILDTKMNMLIFIHACVLWFAADLLVIFKIIKSYFSYRAVNEKS